MYITLIKDALYFPIYLKANSNSVTIECNSSKYGYFADSANAAKIINIAEPPAWVNREGNFNLRVNSDIVLYRVPTDNVAAFMWAETEVACDVLQCHPMRQIIQSLPETQIASWKPGNRPPKPEVETFSESYTQIFPTSLGNAVQRMIDLLDDKPLLQSILNDTSLGKRIGNTNPSISCVVRDNLNFLTSKTAEKWLFSSNETEEEFIFKNTEGRIATMDKESMLASPLFDITTCPWLVSINRGYNTFVKLEFNASAYESVTSLIKDIVSDDTMVEVTLEGDKAIDIINTLFNAKDHYGESINLFTKYFGKPGIFLVTSSSGELQHLGRLEPSMLEDLVVPNFYSLLTKQELADLPNSIENMVETLMAASY